MGIRGLVAVVTWTAVAACGGSEKPPDNPLPTTAVRPPPPPETDADREAKRHNAALALVPDGSSCLPASLRDNGAPRLDVVAINNEAVVCAVDTDRSRLLGPVGCWKPNLHDGTLTYQAPAPLPGHDVDVKLDDHCARGFCFSKDTALPPDRVAHMSWNLDLSKVAALVGDDVHIFDAATKQEQSKFSIRSDKGPTGAVAGIDFLTDYVLVEAGTPPATGVWVFKANGTLVGPITEIGGTAPISTAKGSLLLLDDKQVAIAEQGFSTVTTYELANGRRTKLVRKVNKPNCKPEEIDTYWKDGDKVTDKCRDSMSKTYEYLIGAPAVAGKSNWLVVLRGSRLGELGVLDARTLAEKKAIKMPWCDAAGAAAGSAAAPASTP